MKLSLKWKVIIAVLLFTVILSTCTVLLSYMTYTRSFQKYYESLATSIAKSTATVVDKQQVRTVADEVLSVYGDICVEYGGAPDYDAFSEADWEAYYADFAYIMELPEYQSLLSLLSQLRQDNGVVSLYLGYHELDTMKDLYLVDASEKGENCIPGDYDDVEPAQVEKLKAGDFEMPPYITNYEDYGWLCSASAPIWDEDGTVIGVALVDISMNEIMADANAFLRALILTIAMAALAMALLILFLVNRVMVSPINRLSTATGTFITEKQAGNAASAISKLDIRTGDEIETLSHSIKTMEQELNAYITDLTAVTAEKERIGAELDVAAKIQADMLPCVFPAFPDRHEFDIYATMTPAKEVGGDFYDFFLVDDDHIALVIADVSGKGVPAALFMMISKTLIKSAAQAGLSPKEVLEKVNNQLCENNDAEMFVTVWLGILEISSGKMVCSNAGHEYPAIRRGDGSFELYNDKHGFVLAGMEHSRYQEYELALSPGDVIFVYTDGVAEATDANCQLFGTDRMLAALNRQPQASCKDLLAAVREEIDTFVGDAPQFDDITMLCLQLSPRVSLTVTPTVEALESLTAFVEQSLNSHEVPDLVMAQLLVAVDEICSNIAQYSGAQALTVDCSVRNQRVTLVFSDDGTPYDPLKRADPDITLSAEERTPGGLGIYMVKKTMDSVQYHYRAGRNILTLQKNY